MKKLVAFCIFIIGLSNSAIAMASCGKSIALTNLSNGIVHFSTVSDPGYVPKVNVSQDYILPGDFIVTCNPISKTCNIIIDPTDDTNGKQSTWINNVPLGARIYYSRTGVYAIDDNAGVSLCQ